MNLLRLLIGFLKVGLFSFGGAYGAIPLIRDVVLSNGWLTDEELTNMIAISESTPGPIMVNIATYVGSSQGGVIGALLATFAVVLPAFLIIILVTAAMKKLLKNQYVQAVMNGLMPSIIGIILATGAYLVLNNILHFTADGTFQWKAILLTIALSAALPIYKRIRKKTLSPFLLIIASAICGILIF